MDPRLRWCFIVSDSLSIRELLYFFYNLQSLLDQDPVPAALSFPLKDPLSFSQSSCITSILSGRCIDSFSFDIVTFVIISFVLSAALSLLCLYLLSPQLILLPRRAGLAMQLFENYQQNVFVSLEWSLRGVGAEPSLISPFFRDHAAHTFFRSSWQTVLFGQVWCETTEPLPGQCVNVQWVCYRHSVDPTHANF